jgi:N-methylhydantoinase A
VTDADVVLGLLRPESFLAGRMPLDVNAARAAVGRLAGSLGLGLEETAAGIVNVNNLHAATLIRQQTLERGLDPRDFVLYSYGGAGPVHAFGYAGEIGIREVVIPLGNGASTLSAYGIAAGDVARFVEIETAQQAPFDDTALSSAVAGLVKLARQAIADAGVTQEPHVDVWALMRYQEQLMHALEVPVDLAGSDGAGLSRRFTQEYARRYGESAASAFQAAEIFTLRARARVPAAARWAGDDGAASPAGRAGRTAEVYWPDAGTRLGTAVHDGGRLSHGDEITGPALVELSHTTIAVPRAATLIADHGHFRLLLPADDTTVKGAAR